ncbi:unnamed protein product [Scytosiphon promiscuus]
MSIGKFEFTSIEEVDPVDIWSIIGAIGGIWSTVRERLSFIRPVQSTVCDKPPAEGMIGSTCERLGH